jgi:hypothetical protein
MSLKEGECQHRKTVRQVLQSDGYLVIAVKDGKVNISYVVNRQLITGIATALQENDEVRSMINAATLMVLMNQ